MDKSSAPSDADEWQPATSRPGELYTVEGRVKSVGAFARGMKNRDPRLRAYRRSMQRSALVVAAAAAVVVVIAVVVSSVF